MSLKIDRVQLEIEIKTDATRQEMQKLEEKMTDCRRALKKMDKDSSDYAKKSKELQGYQIEYDKLVDKIGIAGLSVNQLRNRQKDLNAVINKLPADSPLYKQYKQQLDEINLRMKELKGTAIQTEFSLSKLADGFNRYAAIGASFIASMTGVTLVLKKSVEDYAQISEVMADVRKYTGMTSEEVQDLNEDLKKMDTRTSREQLNNLASDAGKLGISGKKNILDFVDAANIINVSLGEDLGKDAVKNIGKLAQMFGDDKTMGLRGAMLATGSAINQVAQTSSAAEPYLVDFMSRVAGTGKQAGISQAQIIGYASVLDQNMQQVEMAATAVQNLIIKVYQSPAKFAKMAGKEVKEFTNLMKSDANEAILTLIESLGKKGGLEQLAPMFKEMGLDGVRASGVLNTLASNVQNIRIQQEQASKAYSEGTSVLNEYSIQNNTVQAGLDKAKKEFKEISYELGGKLEPYMGSLISTTGSLVRILSVLISFITTHTNTLTSVVLAIVAYTTVTKGAILMDKLHVLWTDKIIVSLKGLYSTMIANPYLATIAAIGVLIGVFRDYNQELTESEISQRRLNDIKAEATKGIALESKVVEQYLSIARDETLSKGEREAAIKKLNEISPKYFSNLTLEKIGTKEADAAVRDYTESIYALAEAEAIRAKLKEVTEKKISTMSDMDKNPGFWDNLFSANFDEIWEGSKAGLATMVNQTSTLLKGTTDNWADQTIDKWANRYVDKLKGLAKEETTLTKMLKDNITKSLSRTKTEDDKGGGDGNKGGNGKEDKKPWEIRLQQEENAYKELTILDKKESNRRGQTENEYQMQAIESEIIYQTKRLNIIKEFQGKTKDKKNMAELGKLESEAKAKILDLDKSAEKSRLDVLTEYKNKRIQKVDDTYEKEKQKLLHQQADGEITEEIYNVKIQALDTLNKEYRLSILQDYLDDVNEMEFANGEDRAKAVESANKAVIDADIAAATQRAKNLQTIQNLIKDFKSKNGLDSELDDKKAQLAALKVFYDSQVILLKEKGQDTTELTKLYNEARLKIEQDTESKILDIKSQYGIDVSAQRYKLELDQRKKAHDQGLLSDNEYEEAKSKLADKKLKERLEKDQKYFDAVSQLSNNFSSIFSNLQDAEVTKVESKYDKQIKAAKANGKDTATLEAKKEEEVNQVKKKYADLQFASAILQITTDTAVGIMSVWANWGWNPIIAGILSGIVGATGISQLAVAKANRDAAKGLKEGGYSDEYVQGFTKSGNSDDVAGAIPVHKNEFVANHEAVQNPSVRRFLDVFNVAQRNGTIRMLNTTQILEQVRTRSGKYSGGYSSTNENTASSSSNNGVTSENLNSDKVSELIDLMRRSNQFLEVIKEKPLYIDPRDVKKALKKVDQLEANVSRSS